MRITRLPLDALDLSQDGAVCTPTVPENLPFTKEGPEIRSGYFDPMTGILTLKLINGETKVVAGFPTLDKVAEIDKQGVGGDDGLAGQNGRDGRDGETGAQGCPGPQGEIGATGVKGQPGKQGEPGDRGERGETGPKGDKGDAGKKGKTGLAGAMGIAGDAGAAGTNGADAKSSGNHVGTNGADGIIRASIAPSPPSNPTGLWLWVNSGIADIIPTPPPTQPTKTCTDGCLSSAIWSTDGTGIVVSDGTSNKRIVIPESYCMVSIGLQSTTTGVFNVPKGTYSLYVTSQALSIFGGYVAPGARNYGMGNFHIQFSVDGGPSNVVGRNFNGGLRINQNEQNLWLAFGNNIQVQSSVSITSWMDEGLSCTIKFIALLVRA